MPHFQAGFVPIAKGSGSPLLVQMVRICTSHIRTRSKLVAVSYHLSARLPIPPHLHISTASWSALQHLQQHEHLRPHVRVTATFLPSAMVLPSKSHSVRAIRLNRFNLDSMVCSSSHLCHIVERCDGSCLLMRPRRRGLGHTKPRRVALRPSPAYWVASCCPQPPALRGGLSREEETDGKAEA